MKNFIKVVFSVILLCLCINSNIHSQNSFKKTNSLKLYDTVSISFVGDIMQHTPQISSALKEGGDSTYNYSNTFKYLEYYFEKSDYVVSNMEFTIGTKPYSGYPLFSAPPQIAQQAQKSGINIFLTANNHIADKGVKGLERTLDFYDNLKVDRVGTYRDKGEEEKNNPLIIEAKGIKFAIFNFTYGTNGMPEPKPYYICKQDSTHIKEVIKRAKEAGVDFIIAAPHWGEEYQLSPSKEQKDFAEMMFREGVNCIIGSHPHVPQKGYIDLNDNFLSSKEKDKGRIVFYSLGNYVSNQNEPPYTQIGMLVELRFVRNTLTKQVKMIAPKWFYTWCFRKGEYLSDFMVAVIDDIIEEEKSYLFPSENSTIVQMKKIYSLIKNKQLIEFKNVSR